MCNPTGSLLAKYREYRQLPGRVSLGRIITLSCIACLPSSLNLAFVDDFQLIFLFSEKLSKVPRLVWASSTLQDDTVNYNRKLLSFLCFYGFCASWGLEWACSVSVRDSRRALEGLSRFVLLISIELYRHCWKHPEERMHLRNAFLFSDAAFLYSREGTEEVIHSHMCVSVLLVVKCWIINTGPGRTVCLSDYVGEDIAFPAIILHNKFLLPIILSLSLSFSLSLFTSHLNSLNMIYYCERNALCVNICMGWPVCERGSLSFSVCQPWPGPHGICAWRLPEKSLQISQHQFWICSAPCVLVYWIFWRTLVLLTV